MKSLTTFIYDDVFHYAILIIATIYILAHYLMCLDSVVINADASYYVGVARLLMEGNTPFVDFALSYTPLSFYLMCIPFSIWGSSFNCAIIVLYFVHVVNAIVIYLILQKTNHSKKIAWLGALLFLLYAFLFEGCMYVLEPFVVFWGLISLWLLQNKSTISIFFAGVCCACSFFCKQYGLGFVIIAIIYIILKKEHSKSSIIAIVLLLFGFLSFSIAFVICMAIQGVEPLQMLSLSGSDYERNGLRGLLAAFYYLIRKLSPLFVALAVSLFYHKRLVKDNFWIISILGIASFMLPCYVRFYKHYLLLVLPFIVFLIVHSFHSIEKDVYKKLFVSWVILTSLIPLYSMHTVYQGLSSLRYNQELVSKEIANYIPQGERNVFLSFNALYLSLTNSYAPPLLHKYGMSNGFVTKQNEVMDMLKTAKYLVISEDDYNNRPSINNSTVKEYIKQSFDLKMIESNNSIFMLYTKKNDYYNPLCN